MAVSSLLGLIDDITTILDDIALMSKLAAKKTAGVLGDDLALNAEQITGVKADRELPIVWEVAKGSLVNKAILIPLALLISAFWAKGVLLLLMIGGFYLCFEGVEKVVHSLQYRQKASIESAEQGAQQARQSIQQLKKLEGQKVRGAIRTDFVLSAEIVVITLGTVAGSSLLEQSVVLAIVAIAITAGVYGLVAAILRLDDVGLYLIQKPQQFSRRLGCRILRFAPYLMKALSVVGTIAMFLVGGGIIAHGVPVIHHWIEDRADHIQVIPAFEHLFESLFTVLLNGLTGIVAGIVALAVVLLGQKAWAAFKSDQPVKPRRD
ncbi:DUF808 domain-containing protein [Alkanindiges sp. WGS2144]|uniref:DUF808 domain-containing protein n=1 Tax=Alkanindiges sp. WGS2144 TaxID=3366808 RepID=UPI003752981D